MLKVSNHSPQISIASSRACCHDSSLAPLASSRVCCHDSSLAPLASSRVCGHGSSLVPLASSRVCCPSLSYSSLAPAARHITHALLLTPEFIPPFPHPSTHPFLPSYSFFSLFHLCSGCSHVYHCN